MGMMRYVLIMGLITFLGACGSTKKKPRMATPPPPKTESKDSFAVIRGPVDTLVWEEINKTSEYDKALERYRLEKKDVYRVKLLLPFEIAKNNRNDINKPTTKLGRMMHYYSGIQMALKQLDKEGVSLDVEVLDAESGRFENKIQACRDADLIIGPRDADQLSVVANYGKVNEITVVSPWKSGSKISRENPYFIQLKPGLKDHYEKIIDHALAHFDPDDIFLVGRRVKEDITYFRFMQAMASTVQDEDRPLNTFFVDEDSLVYGKTAFDSIFRKDKDICVILPHWSFTTDEDFVYNVARKISGEKGLRNVTLYGMPILYESDKIKFQLYRNLNMRICRSTYVDRSSPASKAFREAYFQAYRDFPSEEAYEAYDMMLFMGRNIHNYGRKFQFFLDSFSTDLLQTRFDIQKVYDDGGDSFEEIQYFQNKHLYILSFEEDHFVAY